MLGSVITHLHLILFKNESWFEKFEKITKHQKVWGEGDSNPRPWAWHGKGTRASTTGVAIHPVVEVIE